MGSVVVVVYQACHIFKVLMFKVFYFTTAARNLNYPHYISQGLQSSY